MNRLTLRFLLRSSALATILILIAGCEHWGKCPYPIGIYGVPRNELPAARAAGFSVVTGPATKEYLDSAQQAGLKVLAAPGTSAGSQFQAQRARLAVERFDRHPALWAWYLIDEPDLNRVPPEQVRAAQRFLKGLGAQKPTALVLYQGGEALNYANIADITMVDRYPIPWLPLANFPQHVRMARLALGQKKPLVAVIQAFDWSYYPKLLPGEKNLRPPTYQELRCMTYCALARQANGLFYYCFDGGPWKLPRHPEVWESVKKVVSEVNERLPLFEAQHLWWPYFHEFPSPSTAFNAALESSVIPALLRVRSKNSAVPSGDYLLAVNNTENALPYQITVPEGTNGRVPVFGENRTLKVIDDCLEDNFGPFDVHIYGPMSRKNE